MNQTEFLEIENSRSGICRKIQNLRESQIEWYELQALNHLELERFKCQSNNDNVLNLILAKSPQDEKKKVKDKDYYVTNVTVYLSIINELIDNFSPSILDNDLLIYNYHHLLRGLLFDSLILLNEYNFNIKKEALIYSCSKNVEQHFLTIYHSVKQSIFGQSSPYSFIDIEPNLSISLIRQLVELRIRKAFGILSWEDPVTKSQEPLLMSKLLAAIKLHKDNINLSIPFECLERIYGWSNIFLHSGMKEYSWKPIFVINYLKSFVMGGEFDENGGNIESGIKIPQSILDKIINELEEKNTKGLKIRRCDPQALILNE